MKGIESIQMFFIEDHAFRVVKTFYNGARKFVNELLRGVIVLNLPTGIIRNFIIKRRATAGTEINFIK